MLNYSKAVEKENLMLREKLSNARDELSDATTQLTKISDEISSYKVRLDETTGMYRFYFDFFNTYNVYLFFMYIM